MPRYVVVNSPTYILSTMRMPGTVVEYSGWPGSSLEPAEGDSVAQRVKAFYVEARAKGKKIPRVPNLADFADPEPKPEKPGKPVKDK